MMWGGYGFGWMGPVMGVSAVLWWVLVIAVVLAVVRWLRTSEQSGPAGGGTAPAGDPRQVLDLRFARGEIDAEEYADRRRLLTGS
ncbi:SHOCT domain-containing protein [Actinomycetospora lutea]|uniref:SHOCT domain-containing protein n=1 Tax=Actinomycetospora lutea TaxID=663604 RepID=UPI0023651005|nr:SHOCT domain-containing protein [Actinomycetospora lutea]MDD7939548.1 SHOCT domain-containing protein [Actinomycetospora lutea]